jgi:predicted RNA-binding Zn-ribbon protein involved in translation (DUF1610 family)
MENTEYIRKRDAIDMCGGYTELAYAMAGIESADVVPVVHGKWKKIGVWGRVYKCNQCGNFLDFDAVNAGRGDANFCPNCGADMRGEQNG